jgi:hypothetical protein
MSDHETRRERSRSRERRANTVCSIFATNDIEHFSGDAKARKLHDVYEWVTGRLSSKPVFGGRALSTPWPASSVLDVTAYGK